MYREKIRGFTVESCRYRTRVRSERGEEFANCELVNQVTGLSDVSARPVPLSACQACCESFRPSPELMNPVTASLAVLAALHDGKRRGLSDHDIMRAEAIRNRAINHLDCLHAESTVDPIAAGTATGAIAPLDRIVPPPGRSGKSAVRQWAVGVRTAPRRCATLERCLDSLMHAGWRDIHLFIDGGSIPDRFHHLPGTYRDLAVGAWPSFFLALGEMLMRCPHADAIMLIEDDSLFHPGDDLRLFLEAMLWPGEQPCLVSLYCPAQYTRAEPGWGSFNGRWDCGSLAFIFPPCLAKRFLMDEQVIEHRWNREGTGLMFVDDVIGVWAERSDVPIWYPTPSLVQHIGETSTIGSFESRASGVRRAAWFSGDSQAVDRPSAPNQ